MAQVDEHATACNNTNIIPPSYFGMVGFNSPNGATVGDTYAAVANGQGNSISYGPAGGSVALVRASTSNKWYQMIRTDVVFSLNSLMLLNVTAATIYFYCHAFPNNGPNIYTSTDRLALGRQRESLSYLRDDELAPANYYEIYFGGSSYGAMSNTYYNYHSVSAGSWLGFPLNAAGLAYLATVPTKSFYPGYAFFGLDFENHFLNQGASWVAPSIMSFNQCLLRLYYTAGTQPVRMNISDSFKDCSGMQVNIGDDWKGVKEAYINIGDSWKLIT